MTATRVIGASNRELLLGALLAIREIVNDSEATRGAGDGRASALVHLLAAAADALAHFPELAYGIPPGLVELPDRLGSAAEAGEEPWAAAVAEVAAVRRVDQAGLILALYTLTERLAAAPPMPAPVAEPRGLAPGRVLAAATAVSQPAFAGGALGVEAQRRWERMDVVTCRSGAPWATGAILGLDLQLGGTGRVNGGNPDADFQNALATGARAAVGLLESLGAERNPQFEHIDWQLAGLPPEASVEGQSVALPAALAVIRRASQLAGRDLGPLHGVATGDLQLVAGRWVVGTKQKRATIEAKAKLVRHELGPGVPLIASTDLSDSGIRRVQGLADAALAGWGERWVEWTSRMVPAPADVAIGRGDIGLRAPADNDGLEDAEPRDLDDAVAYFARGGSPAAVIGDLARTGRTTLARKVARRLMGSGAIEDAVWVAAGEGVDASVPVLDRMRAGLEHALLPYGDARVLVILEDLEPDIFEEYGHRVPLDELLPALARDLRQPVLALARYAQTSAREWKTDGIRTFVAWGDSEDAFVDALVAANPARLALPHSRMNAARTAAGPDLGLARAALVEAAAGATTAAEVEERLLRPLQSVQAQDGLRALAALSSLGVALPAEAPEVVDLSREQLARVGAVEGTAGWLIGSPSLARRVVALPPPGARAIPEAGPNAIAAQLVRLLDARFESRHPDAGALLVAVLRGARRRADGSFDSLLDAIRRPFGTRWLPQLRGPLLTAFLEICGQELADDTRQSALEQLVEQTIRPSAAPTVGQLAAMLRRLRRDQPWLGEELLDKLKLGVSEVFVSALASDPGASAEARLSLLRAVLRLGVPDTRRLVHEQMDELFAGFAACRVQDYVNARLAIALMMEHRWAWVDESERTSGIELGKLIPLREGGVRLVGDAEKAHLPHVDAIQRLLAFPPTRSPFGVWLGWLALCDTLDHDPSTGGRWTMRGSWDELVESVQDEVREAVDRAAIPEIVAAVNLLRRYNRGVCVRLFNRGDFAQQLARRLASARSFGERADLLDALRGIHAYSAHDVLSPDGAPDRTLATALAREVARGGDHEHLTPVDPRGVGRLLKSAADVDSLYGSATDGFARAFVDALPAGYVDEVMLHEERTSLVFHFLEGLSSVSVPATNQAVRHAGKRLRTNIRRGSTSWAPRLALKIGELPEVGPELLLGLRREFDIGGHGSEVPGALQSRLRHPRDAESATWGYRLAAALDARDAPLARGIAASLPSRFSALLENIAEVPQLCRIVEATLYRAGVTEPRRRIATYLERAGWDWEEAFARIRDPVQLMPALGALQAFDPAAAQRVARATADDSLLVSRMLNAADGAPARAASLLRTLEKCSAGTGAEVLAAMEERGFRWRLVIEDLLYEQNPRTQAFAARQLLDLGWQPDERQASRLHTRWRDLAHRLRSPAALAEVLRALHRLPDGDAQAVARDDIAIEPLARRLREGALTDLEALPELVRVLRQIGAADRAGAVLRAVLSSGHELSRGGGRPPDRRRANGRALTFEDLATRLPLRSVRLLLEEIPALDGVDKGGTLRAAATERLTKEARRPTVADGIEHWFELGRCAAAASATVPAPARPPATLHRGVPGQMILACGWLENAEWARELALEDYARVTAGGADVPAWAHAVALAAPLLRDLAWDEQRVARAIQAESWAIPLLVARAAQDPALRSAIADRGSTIWIRSDAFAAQAKAFEANAEQAHAALRKLLEVLEPVPPESAGEKG